MPGPSARSLLLGLLGSAWLQAVCLSASGQTLYTPNDFAWFGPAAVSEDAAPASAWSTQPNSAAALEDRIAQLEREVASLRSHSADEQPSPVAASSSPLLQPLPAVSNSALWQPESLPRSGNQVGLASYSAKTWEQNQPSDILTDEPQPKKTSKDATKGKFFEGFKWETEDSEYQLQFHNETQLDIRAYGQPHLDPVNQVGFYIPRMRMIFNGFLTKPIEYNISINKGLGNLDLLDAYLNFNYDPRFQVRFGRFRSPFTYDWYALSNQFLLTPERSVFAINYGYNRNFAAMLHGELCDERLDYALAVANGPRNSYFDENSGKDVLAYLNCRPFGKSEYFEALQHLNLGGSLANGVQDQAPLPVNFRTSANATESAGTLEAVPSFLVLNDNVTEYGLKQLGELHAAYYYHSLSVIGAWDTGFNTYGFTTQPGQVHLPTSGYHVQFGYFLTGEQVTRRTFVDPLQPFDLRSGKCGPGAFEVQARFDHFQVSEAVFAEGLADGSQWTNSVDTVDAGFNWYLTKYVKLDFDWQHSMYQDPVQYRPGGVHRTSDLFWFRSQVYF